MTDDLSFPDEIPTEFSWTRYGKGYSVCSRGDKRFSALFAKMPDGRTLEMWYQCDEGHGKGYQPGGRNWRLGKGKPPLDTTVDLWQEYLKLWRIWADLNPNLIIELRSMAGLFNCTLSDMFATTPVNQARALAVILTERFCKPASVNVDTKV